MTADVHLLVLIHGMWGHEDNVASAGKIIADKYKDSDTELSVLLAQTNRELHTYDGIDWGSERIAEEITARIQDLEKDGKKVTRFSVLGYSLGGLLARYLIGILYARNFFKEVTPVNFATVATPHLGLVRYKHWFSALTSSLGPKLLSRTGEQFYCVDKWSTTGRPLIEVMADKSTIFMKALLMFPNIWIYANAVKDRTVPYVTAGIEIYDPFVNFDKKGLEAIYEEDYEPIVQSYSIPDVPPPPPPPPPFFSKANLKRYAIPLPPFLRRQFPLNIVIYAAIPILIPFFLTLLYVRFSLAARGSRKRIKLLESADSESRLSYLFHKLEEQLGDAVTDMIDDPGAENTTILAATVKTASSSATAVPSCNLSNGKADVKSEDPKATEGQPILTESQKWMAESLNSIPQMRKKIAFIPQYFNTHAVIICRDPVNFPFHEVGKGVIRHWADHFNV